MPRSCLPLSLAVALSAVPARAADLLQIYRDALANDATYASARATRDAGLESLPQGLAPILPTVNATAFTQDNRNNISFRGAAPDSQRQGNSNGFTVTLTQPLFNWQNIQPNNELNPPKPNSMEDWATAAASQGYPVRAQEAALEIAVREIERTRAGHLPTLNIVGSTGSSSSSISTSTSINNNASDATSSAI